MKNNIHKKHGLEDKFARIWYCAHARLNQLRAEKKHNKRSYRQLFKKIEWQ